MRRWLWAMLLLWGFVVLAILGGLGGSKPTADDLCRQGQGLVERGDLAGGTRKFQAALKLDAEFVEAHVGMGTIFAKMAQHHLKNGQEAEAEEFCQAGIGALGIAVKRHSKDPMVYFWRGECYFTSQKFTAAMKDYDLSIALKPKWETHLARAVCHSRLGDDEKAVADYTFVYEATKNPVCLYSRGNCYRRLDRPELASADYQKLIRECRDKQIVDLARRELEAMEQERDFRYSDTDLLLPGSFAFQGQTFERQKPHLLKGGSPKEWVVAYVSGDVNISTYIFPARRSFDEEWIDGQTAIEEFPHHGGVKKILESEPEVAGWGQARQCSYKLVEPAKGASHTEFVLLSFQGQHVKIRVTGDSNTGPLVKHYLGLIRHRDSRE